MCMLHLPSVQAEAAPCGSTAPAATRPGAVEDPWVGGGVEDTPCSDIPSPVTLHAVTLQPQ